MRGVNKVTLIGNATRDAELHQTQTGKPVAHLRLATNRQVGEREVPQFHSIVCWDRLADQVKQFVKKGDPLYIEGRLEYRTFQDEEGKERGVAEVIASDIQFLSRKSGEQSAEPVAAAADEPEIDLADIPF